MTNTETDFEVLEQMQDLEDALKDVTSLQCSVCKKMKSKYVMIWHFLNEGVDGPYCRSCYVNTH